MFFGLMLNNSWHQATHFMSGYIFWCRSHTGVDDVPIHKGVFSKSLKRHQALAPSIKSTSLCIYTVKGCDSIEPN